MALTSLHLFVSWVFTCFRCCACCSAFVSSPHLLSFVPTYSLFTCMWIPCRFCRFSHFENGSFEVLSLHFLRARTPWHMTYTGFPWASKTEQKRNLACCGFTAASWCLGIRHTFCTAGNQSDVVRTREIWLLSAMSRSDCTQDPCNCRSRRGWLLPCVWNGIDQAARLPPASGCVWGLTPTSCAAWKWRWSHGWGSSGWSEERREWSELDVEQRRQRHRMGMRERDDSEWPQHNFILSLRVRNVCSRENMCCGTLEEISGCADHCTG